MQRRSIPSTKQTAQQKLLRLAQIAVGVVLIILSTILLLSWGYEIGEWIGAIIFVLVGIPLGILLFRKILLPFFTKIRE
ncbi:MAG: hypothetical protein MKZ84_06250 [Dehalococcoidia bacterium]|nr:hypothetical protein [Dehalococcoidia bacterium]|tara:strand:+ start:523 stop:759 length:237 start_codon:yes stop_codon:yes gene_type:complete